MKVDRFLWFCLGQRDRELLEQYLSPEHESSVFKWIPVDLKDRVQGLCQTLGMKYRVVYRGPRKDQTSPSFTRSRDATHFSVYLL